VVSFIAAGVTEEVALTTEWEQIVIDIAGINYNTINAAGGVNTGLVVVMAREGADMDQRTVYFDDVTWVSAIGGGEGGAGGTPAAGGAGGAG
jgi:hypothetical protein